MKIKQLPLALCFALSFAATAGQAACYADYKAKQDNPLKLHYGVIELPDSACGSSQAAGSEISARLARQGWTLLNVVSIFDAAQLEGKKASAGQYFLRF